MKHEKTVAVIINGAVYEYAEPKWERLLEGEESASEAVLRHIIRSHRERLLQAQDEAVYLSDLLLDVQEDIEGLRKENAVLRAEQALNWETKPARAKRRKKEEAA